MAPEDAELIVLASGNLGLIYFTAWQERMTLEEIDAAFPNLIPGLITHPGIGFIMVRSEEYGPLALGAEGVYHLNSGHIEGENPLAVFSPHLPQHLCRTDSFEHVPDILVNSFYDPAAGRGRGLRGADRLSRRRRRQPVAALPLCPQPLDDRRRRADRRR